MENQSYKTLRDFYPFYLSQHTSPLNRLLHVIGTGTGLILFVFVLATGQWIFLPTCFVLGYAFAWVGHFFVEKNRPATFTYPVFSYVSDWILFYELITLKRPFDERYTLDATTGVGNTHPTIKNDSSAQRQNYRDSQFH